MRVQGRDRIVIAVKKRNRCPSSLHPTQCGISIEMSDTHTGNDDSIPLPPHSKACKREWRDRPVSQSQSQKASTNPRSIKQALTLDDRHQKPFKTLKKKQQKTGKIINIIITTSINEKKYSQ